ncbi:bacteriohemerythrin [Parendozoicomonas haliclonae]|uniref:Bacteriohemerythrin n=1 Tax=Parendozoicomonas haliclonae TaxID=1960125 RepID=A0A1X7AEJ4_9GAMM|nr:bacteriohemerythrin [Parendozoicomonas haliclonae]SMA33055.1 Bacteriohemerythrin [Parendozoicomonas haliclonae]
MGHAAANLSVSSSQELITWSDSLSVGIQEIDEQHKILVDLLNKLYLAIREHHGNEATVTILDELVDYTRIHFSVEESLMRILDYPDYESHKHHHELLIEQINELRRKVQNGKHIGFELLHFLKNWLTKHIMEEDMEYAPHMLKKGVKANYEQRSWMDRLFHRR